LRKLSIALFFIALVLGLRSQANALQTTFASKEISLNFTVTPSPTPIGFAPNATTTTIAAAERAAAHSSRASLAMAYIAPSDPLDRLVAFVPIRVGDLVAQANPQGNVKVQFTVKPDPKYAYFHIVPHMTSFNAAYGSNTYTCAYEVFARYTSAWFVTDWVYGSNNSTGTPGLNGYPTYNYSTTSLLSWLAEGVTSTFKPFANAGSPGEQTFSGAANTSKQVCIDLTLIVPSSIAAGEYQTTIQYNLIVTI
jgi:hypothetical protein